MRAKSEDYARKTQAAVEGRISRTMVGRAAETELFKRQFDSVLEGGTGLAVISGRPGIGKTFFAEQAAGLFSGGSAIYVHGKFRQYDDHPLSAFSEIIEQAVRHILTLPTESLEHIKKDLKQRLGADAAILLSVCPYAEMLLGTHKAIRTDNLEQLKYRVRKAVGRFLEVASTALFPLILFLDDLQWADALSLQIIETACQDYGFLNLMLVLAYRDQDAGKAYLNPVKLPKSSDISIRLGGLSYDDIDQYLRQIFGQEIERKEYLVRILYGLTLGNPFNISRIVRLLIQEGAVAWSPAGKRWLLLPDRMEKLNLPADIGQLLKNQIDGLEKEDRKLLRLIACCGDSAESFLKILSGMEGAELNARLDRLCQELLLTKSVRADRQHETGQGDGISPGTGPEDGLNRGGEMICGFVHDIVLRLVYNSLEPEEKSDIHYRAAEIITKPEYAASVTSGGALAAASHLLKTDLPLLQQERTDQWATELFRAGAEAKQGAAVEHALEILERCALLLPFCEEKIRNRLSFDVLLELSECRYICGLAEEAKQGFEELLAKYPETESQVKIKRKYINLAAFNGDFEKVLSLGAEILGHLNFRLDSRRLIPDLILSRLLLGAGKIRRIENAPLITDERLLCILETLTVMAPSAERAGDRAAAMVALKLAIISAMHGNSDYTPVAYATYSFILFNILKDHKRGRQLEEVTLSLIGKCEKASSKYVALCILGSLTHHWTNPLADTAARLEQSIEEGEKEDAALYSSYATAFAIMTRFMMGIPLDDLKQYISGFRKKEKRLEHYLAGHIYDLYEDHILRLESGSCQEEDAFFKGDRDNYESKKLFADTIRLNGDIIRLQRLYLEGEINEAYRLAEEIAPLVQRHKGFLMNVEFCFYSILARLAAWPGLTAAEKSRNRRRIKKYLRELARWVRVYPGNHYARYLLAQAEYDALFHPQKAPGRLYREAMDFAEKQGNLSLEALANLLAAKYHRDDRKLSEFYASEAVRLYKEWGADHIGDLIAGKAGNRGTDTDLAGTGAANSLAGGRTAGSLAGKEAGGSAIVGNAGPPYGTADPGESVSGQSAAESASIMDSDILSHLNKMEKLSGDEGYLYLLDLLIRRDYADSCAVFFEKTGEMYLKYEMRKGCEACAHREPVNMNHLSGLPHKVLRYVARTETEILLDQESALGIFANDSYLAEKDRLSLICLPIKYSGVLAGIIYLEKNGEEGFDGSLPSLVRGFLPMLLSRKTNLGEMSARNGSKPQNGHDVLTEREIEVLKLIAEGMSNSEISGRLFITLGTVRNHLSSIYSKLEVDNRVKAVMKAKELKIIQI